MLSIPAQASDTMPSTSSKYSSLTTAIMVYMLSIIAFCVGYMICEYMNNHQRFLDYCLKEAKKEALPFSLRLAHARTQYQVAKEAYLEHLKEPADIVTVRDRCPSETRKRAAEILLARSTELRMVEEEAAGYIRRVKELEVHGKWWWVPYLTKKPEVLVEMEKQLESWSP